MEVICLLENDSLTTEEVAQSLKVSKLTVYDLIKKGELPSFRVGRQIRVDRKAFEQYKKQGTAFAHVEQQPQVGNRKQIVISGQDSCLDILGKHMEQSEEQFRPLRSYIGSLDGLIAMYQGKVTLASTHLYDSETNSYNLPYIRKIFVSKSFIVIHLLKRKAGLYVAKGNPKSISSWEDFKDKSITMVNREPGAGARVLLDEQLRMREIDVRGIDGYRNEMTSHLDVASAVAGGQADVGVGSQQVAHMANIDFVPMIEEWYDLVMLKGKDNQTLLQTVLAVVHSQAFKNSLQALGYNTKETGNIRFEQ